MRGDYGPNRLSFRLALRPLPDMFEFRGRSTRTEVVSFWLLSVLAGLIGKNIGDSAPGIQTVGALWMLLWSWPWLPLLARRLHDQNRSVWWVALPLSGVVIFGLTWLMASETADGLSLHADFWPVQAQKTVKPTFFTIIGMVLFTLIAIANFILYLLPNTMGTNRYGPDPRRGSETTTIAVEA